MGRIYPFSCFIIMPFKKDLRVVSQVVKSVVEKHYEGIAFRADDDFHPGTVVEQIKKWIAEADFCVADVSGANPNVLWEAGYAHALGKPIIQIVQDTEDMPFDIQAMSTLEYSLATLEKASLDGSKTDFHDKLKDAFAVLLELFGPRPRILGVPYDELATLADSLQRQSLTRNYKPILPILIAALEREGEIGSIHPWIRDDAERLMIAISRIEQQYQDIFWWLIVHGVLAYNQINDFQVDGSNGVRSNLSLVHISSRGVALLNRLKNPFYVQAR